MSLRQRVFNLFDVRIPEGTSTEVAVKELGRRGKFDLGKAMQIIFILIDEIDELKSTKK